MHSVKFGLILSNPDRLNKTMKKRIIFAILIGIITAGFVVIFLTPNSRSQNKSPTIEEIPIVDLYVPEPDDPLQKEVQKNRAAKYDTGTPIANAPDPEDEYLELPLSHAPVEPALPITKSDLIVIGKVSEARAFLSNDRSNVYCEFSVRIERLLKNTGSAKLNTNSEIIAERVGGRVRFSSGKIQLRGRYGRELPAKDNRYLLFLQWSESGKDFVIITGYRIQNENVIPLDANTKDSNLPVFKNYDSLRNANLENVVGQVKSTLSSSSKEALDK